MMMKKLIYIVFVLFILSSICSCRKENEFYDTDYSAFRQARKNDSNTADQSSKLNEALSDDIGGLNTEKSDSGNTDENQWPYDFDFAGVTTTKEGRTGSKLRLL